ncbi:GTPase HflX [Erysipelothrix sp. HDW6C]|uniref:GTPase HflX n=1 Tax=Erysipelothrix sp. HDW6C TaxID=2714930 RepID=UPI00140B0EBF|nr:GTPase HflX [Erysipelothrix sp. HDW6C]QIK69650.1 GTPase HflX [Erysipelothrix sp. HDW6C]
METTEIRQERVVIVGVDLGQRDFNIIESMKELSELVIAAGGLVVGETIQNREKVNAKTYIGKGKVEEVATLVLLTEADTVVFNEELTGSQMRNLEEVIQCKIIDRTNLILDIFASRATSKEGLLQVELAQLKYRLPRLVGYSTHLSRLGGGIGTKGPGEQKLELDRRHILKDIHRIESELKKLEENRTLNRKQRLKSHLPIVSLVGYTNAGKSTIMNGILKLSNDDKFVYAEDMLFATLDTSMRRTKLNNNLSILLTDTVGFVSKLPTHLIAAFKGTLEEITFSDCIVHVIDASNPHLDIQVNTTKKILSDLGVADIPMVTVFNKMDLIEHDDLATMNQNYKQRIYISAKNPADIDLLLDVVEDALAPKFRKVVLKLPFSDMNLMDYFASNYDVGTIEYDEEGAVFTVVLSTSDLERFKKYRT